MTERLVRVGGVVLVVWAGILLSLLGVFLTPYRIGPVLVPVSLVLAVLGNWGLIRFAHRLTRSSGLSLLPGVVWVAVTFLFYGQRTEGDVVLVATNWVAQVYLFAGIISISVAAYFNITRPRRPPARSTTDLGPAESVVASNERGADRPRS